MSRGCSQLQAARVVVQVRRKVEENAHRHARAASQVPCISQVLPLWQRNIVCRLLVRKKEVASLELGGTMPYPTIIVVSYPEGVCINDFVRNAFDFHF